MDSALKLTLGILRRQFYQLVDPIQLRWPDAKLLKDPSVQSWIFHNLFDAGNAAYAPPDSYRLLVLKPLISTLENLIEDPEEDEISDDLMSTLSSLFSSNLPSESISTQQKAYVTYTFAPHSTKDNASDEMALTLLEARWILSSAGTTGLRTWEAALLLGSFLCSESGKPLVQNKRVLELGAGTGMLSILCAKHLKVSSIVATDGDEAVVDAIKTNVFLNEQGGDESPLPALCTAALKWGWAIDGPNFAEDYGMDVPQVVLGADVTYDPIVIPSLVSTLREFFDLNSSLVVLVAATIRNEKTFQTFLDACRRNGFSLGLIEFPPVPESLQEGPFYPTMTPIQIWRITRHEKSIDPFVV
ncbi:hypothetical protein EJ04DRAFT_473350 [Polyplosphaeria fusca]|uniref:Methyltransferase-domain-containing protein n=1 Tax=Polyplosphaeria fusca TaxID=682080 RepID=A0A9P4UZ27_9PLEO|nr:hypothetical protein EJ04DRAFT_473350 [Polyplosphaeria fusca]